MRNSQKRIMIKALPDEYAEYTAEFERVGFKTVMSAFKKTHYTRYIPTICLSNIRDCNGVLIADHIWCNYTYDFSQYGELKPGDLFSFKAKPKHYTKGEYCDVDDYKLSQPKNVKLIAADHNIIPLPTSREELVGYSMIKASHYRRWDNGGNEYVQPYIDAYYNWMDSQLAELQLTC
ncbi:hypothetical protein [Limosilactobacillus mucosae]|uniref:Uncharacterized protein n=1 Tax=Limosilactobacillus mucosae TaxID=97478 RepID=A0AAJ1HTY9_LIMMU|nr:hypothetical protein [Limosilactobacillus mucosae]MDC2828510.1 hypothetical protein [Limosilactobacillus mucosae]MDC2834522.1 hypothetical protein [Limosilactobacillus mucosae]